MKKSICIILLTILTFLNTNLSANEDNDILKIGLLAPLSGEYKDLGNSLLYSSQLALNEINDKNVIIIPRDSNLKDENKLNEAINEIRAQGAKIIIGPIDNKDFKASKYFDIKVNNWKLDNLVPSVLEAYRKCNQLLLSKS